jgi:hypothetical protein
MHGIGEQHGFIIAERIEQVFIRRDESLLLRRIKLARWPPVAQLLLQSPFRNKRTAKCRCRQQAGTEAARCQPAQAA